jgi:hypothetical protein
LIIFRVHNNGCSTVGTMRTALRIGTPIVPSAPPSTPLVIVYPECLGLLPRLDCKPTFTSIDLTKLRNPSGRQVLIDRIKHLRSLQGLSQGEKDELQKLHYIECFIRALGRYPFVGIPHEREEECEYKICFYARCGDSFTVNKAPIQYRQVLEFLVKQNDMVFYNRLMGKLAVLLLGIRRYRQSVLGSQPKDILRLLIRYMWTSRRLPKQ